MTRLIILVLLLAGTFNGHCQKTPQDYYEDGCAAEYLKRDSIAQSYFSYVVKNCPTDTFSPVCYFHLGGMYRSHGDFGKAIGAYRKAILGNDSGFTPSDILPKESRYKIYAAYDLSNLYDFLGNYDSALYFLSMYEYAPAVDKGVTVFKRAHIYIHAKHFRDAEKTLLTRCYLSLGSHTKEELHDLFKQHEQAQVLKNELETAVNNFFIDSNLLFYYGQLWYDYPYCYIYFLGAKIRFYSEFLASDEDLALDDAVRLRDRQKIISILKKSDLYLMIQKL